MKKVLAILIGLLLLTGGIAAASIPHSITGVITSCYNNTLSRFRVIDKQAGDSCLAFETELNWNQTGPVGPTGPQGPTGPSKGYDSGVSNIVTVPNNGPAWVTVQSQTLPAGSYVLNAVSSIYSGSGSRCRLFDGSAEIDWRYFSTVGGTGNSNPIGSVTLGSETVVTLDCERTVGTYQVQLSKITAVKVGSLN